MFELSPPQATLPSERGSLALFITLCLCSPEWDHTETETSSLTWLKFSVFCGQLGQ